MSSLLLAALAFLALLNLAGLALLLRRKGAAASESPDLSGMAEQLAVLKDNSRSLEGSLNSQFGSNREEARKQATELRKELREIVAQLGDSLGKEVRAAGHQQKERLETFAQTLDTATKTTDRQGKEMRESLDAKLRELRHDNAKELAEIRKTVDEKLETALAKRLGESFKQVSERLEQVHQGLGEMQTLATGVGDLKRVLTNARTRGAWGEVRLEALLADSLTPEQYETQAPVSASGLERADAVIRLPGREQDGRPVLLPVDAKFPHDDFERITAASEAADPKALDEARKSLRTRVMNFARDIREKYVHPPRTTEFAILFLPTESLFAEIARQPGLLDSLRREHQVVIAGPTTFMTMLNAFQAGFRILAIEKRSSEVWNVLEQVKTEFGRFGESLDKVRKSLQAASNNIDRMGVRTRKMSSALQGVERLESGEERPTLPFNDAENEGEPFSENRPDGNGARQESGALDD